MVHNIFFPLFIIMQFFFPLAPIRILLSITMSNKAGVLWETGTASPL